MTIQTPFKIGPRGDLSVPILGVRGPNRRRLAYHAAVLSALAIDHAPELAFDFDAAGAEFDKALAGARSDENYEAVRGFLDALVDADSSGVSAQLTGAEATEIVRRMGAGARLTQLARIRLDVEPDEVGPVALWAVVADFGKAEKAIEASGAALLQLVPDPQKDKASIDAEAILETVDAKIEVVNDTLTRKIKLIENKTQPKEVPTKGKGAGRSGSDTPDGQ